MGSVFGKGQASAPATVQGLKPQSSAYGGVVPVVQGVTRIAGNLILYTDFQTHVPSQSGKGGTVGKGGKGGNTTYSATFMFALCEGGASGIIGVGPSVWSSQAEAPFGNTGFTLFKGAFSQSPWSYLTTHYPNQAEGYSGFAYVAIANFDLGTSPTLSNYNFEVQGLNSQISAVKTLSVPGVAPFQVQVPRSIVTGTSTNSQGGTFARSYTYFSNNISVRYHGGALLTLVGSSPSVGQYTVDTTGLYGFNPGDANASLDFTYSYVGDADPSVIVTDILTNQGYGVDLPASRLGTVVKTDEAHTIPGTPYQIMVTNAATFLSNLDVVDGSGNIFTAVPVGNAPGAQQYSVNLSTGLYAFNPGDTGTAITIRYSWRDILRSYQAFCWSLGLMMSPAFDQQTQISSLLNDWALHTYSEWVLQAGGVLGIFPRGESAVADWGFSYTPNNVPLFNLTDDDFMENSNATGTSGGGSNTDPVILTRSRPIDQVNNIKLEFLDRANQYSPAVAEITDQANLDLFHRRSSASRTAHWFCDVTAANTSVQLQLQKEQVRNTYSFQLDPRYCPLDPMDPVTIQDPKATNGVQTLVRITEITENDDGTLSMVAEEYPNGTGAVALYNYGTNSGAVSNFNQSSSSVNAPMYLDVPVGAALNAGGSSLETWALLSGVNMTVWGGCDAHLSTDGTTYVLGPKLIGASRMGSSTADFPADGDPDTTDTLSVDLTESLGTLASTTQANADNALSLCAIMINPGRAQPPLPTFIAIPGPSGGSDLIGGGSGSGGAPLPQSPAIVSGRRGTGARPASEPPPYKFPAGP